MKCYWYEDWYDTPHYGQTGYASTLPIEHSYDPVAELRAVVEEVTGVVVESAEKPRIGFI